MNELILVTNTLLYRPGDEVTGNVWLDICTPTTGRTLYISLIGTETCEKLGVRNKEKEEVFTHDLIPNNDLLASWQATNTFPFGSYRIPFELTLPKNLPGSFKCHTLEGWRLSTHYTVHAYVVEDDDLSDTDTIVVSQLPSPADSASAGMARKCQTFEVKQFLGLSKALVILECSLHADMVHMAHTFASHLTFDVSIQNTSKTNKIMKRSLKLVQCLSLCGRCVITESVMDFVTGNCYKPDVAKLADGHDQNFNTVKRSRAYSNAAKSSAEWQRVILTENICDKPDCSVILDLSQCDRKHTSEGSVSGTTIKCQYQVILSVTMDDGDTFSAQPCDIWIHSHSDTNHEPSNGDKLAKVKQQPMFLDAVTLDESMVSQL